MVGDDLRPEWRGQADPVRTRRVSSITVAPVRKVMFAPGQRWQAAWYALARRRKRPRQLQPAGPKSRDESVTDRSATPARATAGLKPMLHHLLKSRITKFHRHESCPTLQSRLRQLCVLLPPIRRWLYGRAGGEARGRRGLGTGAAIVKSPCRIQSEIKSARKRVRYFLDSVFVRILMWRTSRSRWRSESTVPA
jgi:hypothetical protein